MFYDKIYMIEKSLVEKIRKTADIVEVIGNFVNLKKRGVNYIGRCPFHDEKTPSFTVSPAKDIYKCFGCGASGKGAISFLMAHDKLSYPLALKQLAKKYNIPVQETELSAEQQKEQQKKESLFIINKYANSIFIDNLNGDNILYLKKRGFSEKIIKKFELGFCNPDFNQKALKNGHLQENLLQSGLCINGKYGNFPRFKNRITFPIHTLSGQIAGFSARSLSTNKKIAKYQNSPESDIYHKSKILYGLFQAKTHIIRTGKCYFVEGNPDVISFYQKNIKNVVAGSGTSLHREQILLLKKFANEIILVGDADNAGFKATLKNIDLFIKENLQVKIISLPEGEDPDSFAMKKTESELLNFLQANETDFVSYKAQVLYEFVKKTPQAKAEATKSIATTIKLINNKIEQNEYLKNCSSIMNVDEKEIRNLMTEIDIEKLFPAKEKGPQIQSFPLEFSNEIESSIKKEQKLNIYADINEAKKQFSEDNFNIYALERQITIKEIKKIQALCNTIVIHDNKEAFYNAIKIEKLIVLIAKRFVFNNFNVLIQPDANDEVLLERISFIEYYIRKKKINLTKNDKELNEAINSICELLSYMPSTIQEDKLNLVKKLFGLNFSALRKNLKQFTDKQDIIDKTKNKNPTAEGKQTYEISSLSKPQKDEFYKKGFSYVEENEKRVAYLFRANEDTLVQVYDFYLTGIAHIYSAETKQNVRLVQIAQAGKDDKMIAFPSDDMVKVDNFHKIINRKDGYGFMNANANRYEKIRQSIVKNIPKATILNNFGHKIKKDIYTFSNAYYSYQDNEIIQYNKYGIGEIINGSNIYSPFWNKLVEADNDEDDNPLYNYEAKFVYKDVNHTSVKEWTNLMAKVYNQKNNKNGWWGIVFAIMSAYRSDIYEILNKTFTAIFLTGATQAGKNQLAVSIAEIYGHDAPIININKITDAAFGEALNWRNILRVLDEYSDSLPDTRFEMLKGALEGVGRQKIDHLGTGKTKIDSINSSFLMMGQVSPLSRNHGALGNRMVILRIPKVEIWSDDAFKSWTDLKNREKKGLWNILIEILKNKKTVISKFEYEHKNIMKAIKKTCSEKSIPTEPRVLNSVAIFITIAKIFKENIPEFHLPFTYDEFYETAIGQIASQSAEITVNAPIGMFFKTLSYIIDLQYNDAALEGREFMIKEIEYLENVRTKGETIAKYTLDRGKSKILFLHLTNIHPKYAKFAGKDNLSQNNLMKTLKEESSFIHAIKSIKWEWKKQRMKFDALRHDNTLTIDDAFQNTSAIAFYYDDIKEKYGIDLERFAGNGNKPKPDTIENNLEIEKQTEIIFGETKGEETSEGENGMPF